MGDGEAKQMMSDSGNELAGFDPERYSGENISVDGQPAPGNVVEIAYKSNAGGAWAASGLTEVRGELLYCDHRFKSSPEDGRMVFVIQDSERGRAVAVDLDPDPGKIFTDNVRSLKAGKTRRGRRLGRAEQVTFTDESVNTLAPIMNAVLATRPGDTIMVDGTEYGVVSTTEYGPDDRPSHVSAILTRPDGSEFTLKTSQFSGDVEFGVRFGDELEMDPSTVQVGRFRERYYNHENEGLDTEGTDDAFPTPHGAREGERLTLTIHGENGEDERVSGEVTNVRRYPRVEYYGMDADTMDPETTVELDDGREVNLRNVSKNGRWVTRSRWEKMDDHGEVRAFVVTRYADEDRENEYVHTTATDITPEGVDAPEVRTDGGVDVEADGGEVPDHLDTWKYREGEDGEPVYVHDVEEPVAVEYEREDGADPSEGTLTYIQPDGESITISPGDTILGRGGEDVVDVAGYCVTVDPYLAVEAYVDLPPEDGGGVPMSPLSFAIRFLGYEDNDGFHFHMDECVAASGEELEQARWADAVDTLRTLDVGDRILWGERSEPLTVTGTGLAISQYIRVEGPRGGEYTIRWRDSVPTVRRGGVQGDSLGRPHGLTVVSRTGEDGGPEVRTDGGEDVETDGEGEDVEVDSGVVEDHPPAHLDHVTVTYNSRRSGRDITKRGTVRAVHPDGGRYQVPIREDGENGRESVLLVAYTPGGDGHVFSQTKNQTTHLGPLKRLAVEGEHVDLCPECGRPFESFRVRPDSDRRVYTHESEITNPGGIMSFRQITDSCFHTPDDGDDDGEPEVRTDGGREPLNVSADEWADMGPLRFPRFPHTNSERVEDEPTSMSSLSEGDVVVLDIGKHTGPRSRRRTPAFNRTAYRVEDTGYPGVCEFSPSDGRAARLTAKRGSWRRGSGSYELWTDVQRRSADAKAYRVLDVPELETDGGQDPAALASAVREAVRESDLSLSTVSVSVSDPHDVVTITANGGSANRERWRVLRDTITGVLDANGFQYRARDAWAFVEVTGGGPRTDGGTEGGGKCQWSGSCENPATHTATVYTRGPGGRGGPVELRRCDRCRELHTDSDRDDLRTDGGEVEAAPERDPHANVKQRLITLNVVQWAGTRAGSNGSRYLAVSRDADPDGDELEGYHILMDLAGYVDLDPSVLDDEGGGVDADGVTLDVWKQKETPAGAGGGPDV